MAGRGVQQSRRRRTRRRGTGAEEERGGGGGRAAAFDWENRMHMELGLHQCRVMLMAPQGKVETGQWQRGVKGEWVIGGVSVPVVGEGHRTP